MSPQDSGPPALLGLLLSRRAWRLLVLQAFARALAAWRAARLRLFRYCGAELAYLLPVVPPVLLALVWRRRRLRHGPGRPEGTPPRPIATLASVSGGAQALSLALQSPHGPGPLDSAASDCASDQGSEASTPSCAGLANLGAGLARASRLAALAERRRRSFSGTRGAGDDLVTLLPFRENRWRLLTGEIRNLETMQPFAALHLRVGETRHPACLIEPDSQGSLYVLVFVNNELKAQSLVVAASRNPEWRFDVAVDVYSPLSMVRVAVMSCEAMSKDRLLGFVEFRAAELLSHGSAASGWLELRTRDKLQGTAACRFREHRACRDDAAAGRGPNAGEVHLSVRSEVLPTPRREAAALPWWRLVLEALFLPGLLRKRELDDEWYACCFPLPRLSPEQSEGWYYLKDLKELHDQLTEVHELLMDQVVRKATCLFLYVAYWQCCEFSLCVLLHWWLCCVSPVCLLPSLPLWAAVWLYLLRDPAWRRDLLLHGATAPLNGEGFEMVTSRNDSEQIFAWLCRLIWSRCGTVKVEPELREFTKHTFEDGRPTLSFQMLLDELDRVPWVSWRRRKLKRCRLGHVLELWGSSSYQRDYSWSCAGPKDVGCPIDSRAQRGLHLGVARYHCATCGVDVCGACVRRGRAEASVLAMVPVMGFESVRWLVFEMGAAVRIVRRSLLVMCEFVDRLLDPEEDGLAWQAYFLCGACSAFIAGFGALPALGSFGLYLRTLVLLAAGTAIFTQNATWARRLRTVCRANWDFLAVRELRAGGGCATWAFLTLDATPA